ncbi:MAG: hypothetical protein K2G67_05230 [Muribaculaceae bacterium]|nr:hypothetical protein [Muribaculaceae bacterium]
MENWLGNTSEGNMKLIPFEVDAYGAHSYIIYLSPRYGEFGVRVVNPHNVDERIPVFYCFGTSSYGAPVVATQDLNASDVKDGSFYEYKNILWPVYKKASGERYIITGKDEVMYLPEDSL